jgi:hypothetical protein
MSGEAPKAAVGAATGTVAVTAPIVERPANHRPSRSIPARP